MVATLLHDFVHSLSDNYKHFSDGLSAAVIVTTLAGWLPAVAALMSIVWTGLRIYEWIEKRRAKKKQDEDLAAQQIADKVRDHINELEQHND